MANIYINDIYSANDTSITGVSNVRFNYLTDKVYSATKIDRSYGVFISNVIIASEYFVRWNDLSWTGEDDAYSKVYLYVRTGTSSSQVLAAEWVGPYSNESNDISWATGMYMQFMVILRNDTGASVFPIINSIRTSFLSLEAPVKFFTRTFNIGFVPKHLLLTYNAQNETDDDIIRFAISGEDSANIDNYLYINPNKIEDLGKLGFNSTQLKVMLELGGVSGTNVSVDEFALTISGDGSTRFNEIYMVSSSSSSSTNSSATSATSDSSESSSTSSESSSSQSLVIAKVISGTNSPNINGDYIEDGILNGYMSYKRTDDLYSLYYINYFFIDYYMITDYINKGMNPGWGLDFQVAGGITPGDPNVNWYAAELTGAWTGSATVSNP